MAKGKITYDCATREMKCTTCKQSIILTGVDSMITVKLAFDKFKLEHYTCLLNKLNKHLKQKSALSSA